LCADAEILNRKRPGAGALNCRRSVEESVTHTTYAEVVHIGANYPNQPERTRANLPS
jgi:hypothetical protein